ncbi:MAG: acetyl-CoA hydrolase [Deltaproteobacteria bacterium]|nr:MAG: acetyl-CoA hydrolase [Deltaproteobacteria bacterium]
MPYSATAKTTRKDIYWADAYLKKKVRAKEAVGKIRSGQRVFLGSGCGEPQKLIQTLVDASGGFSGLEVVRLFGRETASLTAVADRTHDTSLNVRSIYLGATADSNIARQKRFITPMNMSDIPMLFTSRRMPLDAAVVQVSPPDDFGWMSLGIAVDVSMAAVRSADMVIVQVNSRMPRIMGQSFIHVNDVDWIVECDEELITVTPPANRSRQAQQMGKHAVGLIEDGATLQIGLAAVSQATMEALSCKNDLGVHSQFMIDDIMHLYSTGNITNKKKGLNEGKMVASMAIGSSSLYEFLHDNPAVDFHPSDYVNNPFIIARHNRMVSINMARAMDITGQVSAEATAATHFGGVSGIPDFVRGARQSPGGKSILLLFAVNETGAGLTSNIVAKLGELETVVPRGDVHYVVTEFGAVNLFGKSIQERVIAMISIAHPQFREELFAQAKELGYIGSERSLGEAAQAVYPVQLEETIERDGEQILIRPAKPVDDRRIQEHYYNLPQKDVESRFFCKKKIFSLDEIESHSFVDYVNDLTLIAVTGEMGFGRVVGVAECMKIEAQNMAEVAFSVTEEYQGKGIGRFFIHKLAAIARENGIAGLVAVTNPGNKAMIHLFKSLPYRVESVIEDGDMVLTCRFSEMVEKF